MLGELLGVRPLILGSPLETKMPGFFGELVKTCSDFYLVPLHPQKIVIFQLKVKLYPVYSHTVFLCKSVLIPSTLL